MKHLREDLSRRGVLRAEELRGLADGVIVEVGGMVIGRQRPGTASGVTFVTLEVGAFALYSIACYAVFVPWERYRKLARRASEGMPLAGASG